MCSWGPARALRYARAADHLVRDFSADTTQHTIWTKGRSREIWITMSSRWADCGAAGGHHVGKMTARDSPTPGLPRARLRPPHLSRARQSRPRPQGHGSPGRLPARAHRPADVCQAVHPNGGWGQRSAPSGVQGPSWMKAADTPGWVASAHVAHCVYQRVRQPQSGRERENLTAC